MESGEWRPAPDWPAYEISSFGRVRRRLPARCSPVGRVMTATTDRDGYARVGLYDKGRHGCVLVHRLMALAFLPAPGRGQWQVAHNDGRPGNNRVDNLRWATPRENQRDRRKHETQTRGEGHPNAKLTEREVRSIRRLAPGRTLDEVACKFGIAIATVSGIVNRKSWRHIQ